MTLIFLGVNIYPRYTAPYIYIINNSVVKMKQITSILLLTFALVPLSQANNTILAKLADITTQPEINSKVKTIFTHDEQRISTCSDDITFAPHAITVFNAPKFDGEFLQSGVWQMRYTVNACNQLRKRTALFSVQNGENLKITSLLPGETLADIDLQADARQSFFMSAIKIAPNCNKPFITHTQVTQEPTGKDSPWKEAWTANFCGEKIVQTIAFQPNNAGTSFVMTAVQ